MVAEAYYYGADGIIYGPVTVTITDLGAIDEIDSPDSIDGAMLTGNAGLYTVQYTDQFGFSLIVDAYRLVSVIDDPNDPVGFRYWLFPTDDADISGGTVTDVTQIGTEKPTWSDIICFCSGTLIRTMAGEKSVENLKIGDKVPTMDSGYQKIRWIGSRNLSLIDQWLNPKLLPVQISTGALGNGLPEQDLRVSRQHPILVQSQIAERMFGFNELLIPASKLTPIKGIKPAEITNNVVYFHMLFDKHEIIFANGAASESLYTGPEAMKSLSPEARSEIAALFPHVEGENHFPDPARPFPQKGRRINRLVERHAKHAKPLFTECAPVQ